VDELRRGGDGRKLSGLNHDLADAPALLQLLHGVTELSLVETEARCRYAEEEKQSVHEARQNTRGQWMAFALTLLLAAVGSCLGLAGHDWLAATFFTTTIGAVVTIFALGNKSRAREDGKSDSSTEEVTHLPGLAPHHVTLSR
jgi:hypothetical protein